MYIPYIDPLGNETNCVAFTPSIYKHKYQLVMVFLVLPCLCYLSCLGPFRHQLRQKSNP